MTKALLQAIAWKFFLVDVELLGRIGKQQAALHRLDSHRAILTERRTTAHGFIWF